MSDGRGLFLEGKERVMAAVRAARSVNVFVIFVVLDNPNSRVRDEGTFTHSTAEPELLQVVNNQNNMQIFSYSTDI